MKCIWCDRETQTTDENLETEEIGYADKEHVFPECVGGVRKFENGEVCKACNRRLGNEVDKFLQDNFMMIKQWQDSSLIKGKPSGKRRDKEDWEIKKAEIYDKKTPSGTRIIRNPESTNFITAVCLPNGMDGDFTYNEKFSKALHKCVVNVLLYFKGYDYVKKNYPDLIDFVNDKNNHSYHNWSYGICYGDMFAQIHFEPFCLNYKEIKIKSEIVIGAVVLIFPSVLFVACPFPNFVEVELLETVGSNPPPTPKEWTEQKFDYIKHFQMGFSSPRKTFGEKIKFTLVKKEIEGKPDPDPENKLYLLTKCPVCDQINPTGISLPRETVFRKPEDLSKATHWVGGDSPKHSWNKMSKEDLMALGLAEKDCVNTENRRIFYHAEYDVKKMQFPNYKTQCINCRQQISYNVKDCFL